MQAPNPKASFHDIPWRHDAAWTGLDDQWPIPGQGHQHDVTSIVPISACRPPRPISTSSIASAVRARTRDSTTARTTAKRLLGSATHAMHMRISRHYSGPNRQGQRYSRTASSTPTKFAEPRPVSPNLRQTAPLLIPLPILY